MGMDRNTTLTHVYGVVASVISVVGGIALFTSAATWRDYLLYASGWACALLLGAMLSRSTEQARLDGLELGSLRGEVESLRATLEQRTAMVDYFGAKMMGERALPRTVVAQNQEGEK